MVSHKAPFWDHFYLFYMSRIFPRASELLFSVLFADDTTVLIEGHEYQNLMETLNKELCKVDQ